MSKPWKQCAGGSLLWAEGLMPSHPDPRRRPHHRLKLDRCYPAHLFPRPRLLIQSLSVFCAALAAALAAPLSSHWVPHRCRRHLWQPLFSYYQRRISNSNLWLYLPPPLGLS